MDLIYAFMNQFFCPFCPNFTKEGGGPDFVQDVPNFFCPKLGGEGGGQMNLRQIPKIFTFFLKASLSGELHLGFL